jgi:glycine/D-amino acid oxidase-like deaminating enzyme
MLISMPHVVVQPAKPRIAIIGSGLAGEVLAAKLAAFCHVTVYERGSLNGYSPPVLAKGRSLGLTSTISYGRGGTTALWRGNMLEMEPDEYGSHWPESVRKEMPRFQAEVIDHRVGARSNASWSETNSGTSLSARSWFDPCWCRRRHRVSLARRHGNKFHSVEIVWSNGWKKMMTVLLWSPQMGKANSDTRSTSPSYVQERSTPR